MANIVIKDLTESIDLDRQAMTAVIGGSRLSRQQAPLASAGRMVLGSNRVVNLPRFRTAASPDKSLSSVRGTPLK